MNWYWRVRIYKLNGDYAICQVETPRDLQCIKLIADVYETMTGCRMLIEGMAETKDEQKMSLGDAFKSLWNTEVLGHTRVK
jgi:hypothetical protein